MNPHSCIIFGNTLQISKDAFLKSHIVPFLIVHIASNNGPGISVMDKYFPLLHLLHRITLFWYLFSWNLSENVCLYILLPVLDILLCFLIYFLGVSIFKLLFTFCHSCIFLMNHHWHLVIPLIVYFIICSFMITSSSGILVSLSCLWIYSHDCFGRLSYCHVYLQMQPLCVFRRWRHVLYSTDYLNGQRQYCPLISTSSFSSV